MINNQNNQKGKTKKNKKKNNKPQKETKPQPSQQQQSPQSQNKTDEISITLPQSVNEKVVFNDLEVTLKQNEASNKMANDTVSKKKKKKSKKNNPVSKPETAPETTTKNGPVFEYSLDKINRAVVPSATEPPQMSITMLSDKTNCNNVPSPESGVEQKISECSDGTNTVKKKKKKKKKKKSTSSEPDNGESNSTKEPTEQPNNVTNENSPVTYEKLTATGEGTVLVVSLNNYNSGQKSQRQSESHVSVGQPDFVPSNSFQPAQDVLVSSNIQPGTVQVIPSNQTNATKLPSEEAKKDERTNERSITSTSGIIQESTIEDTSVQKTKAQLKAERRAIQEAQRAAKLASKTNVPVPKSAQNEPQKKNEKKPVVAVEELKSKLKSTIVKSNNVKLFSHLPPYKSIVSLSKHFSTNDDIHPAMIALGIQCAEGIMTGSNARCVALLAAVKEVIKDYVTPSNKELSRDLEAKLQLSINFVAKCRPLSVSMINAVKRLKQHITGIPNNMSDKEAKALLSEQIAKFVTEEILLARDAISTCASAKIVENDVIVTYSCSSVIKNVFLEAHSKGKKFRVIVVDSRPKTEGREMLRWLVRNGISCCYTLINAIGHVMREATKVIIGAHALQANGYVMSRIGSSQIALVASWYNVPFLVCCETYKFCEKVHTDSIVHNEFGDPESLVKTNSEFEDASLTNWKEIQQLQLLNLMYDITPPDLVSMVITEKGMLPCTSVPVVLRVRHAGQYE